MAATLRQLAPVVGCAIVFSALLIIWIRFQPIAMPRGLQIALTTLAIAAFLAVIVLVVRVERQLTLSR